MCIFGGKKGFLHKVELGLCIFEGKAGNLQNEGLGLCISRRKKDFCKININKKDASEWEIGTETEQISCFVKFYLTELL